jgi:hypothetical protein
MRDPGEAFTRPRLPPGNYAEPGDDATRLEETGSG